MCLCLRSSVSSSNSTAETRGLCWQCGLQLQRQRGFSESGAASTAARRQLALLVLCRCGSVQLQQLAAFSWRLQFNLQRQQQWRLDKSSASAAATPALQHHLALAVAASALQHCQQHSAVRRCSITVISATAITATATAAPISVNVSRNSICTAAWAAPALHHLQFGSSAARQH